MDIFLHCKGINWCCNIHTDENDIFECCKKTFKMLFSHNTLSSDVTHLITIKIDKKKLYLIYEDCRTTSENRKIILKDNQSLIYYLNYFIDYSFSIAASKKYALFHGASLLYDNQAICLLAPSRMGKTTLTYNLCVSGFNYMGDDHVIYNLKSNECISFPRPLAARDLNVLYPSDFLYTEATDFEGCPKFFFYELNNHIKIGRAEKAKAFFVLNRSKEFLSPSVIKLNSAIAFQTIIYNGREECNMSTNIKAAKLICNNACVYQLNYFDTKGAISEIFNAIKQ